jgi:hypothetical protein
MSYHKVALCDTDQPTFIQLLDIRWDACFRSLLSPLRHAHVSLRSLFDVVLTSAKSSESHTNDFFGERRKQLQQIVSEVFGLSIIATSNDFGHTAPLIVMCSKRHFPYLLVSVPEERTQYERNLV